MLELCSIASGSSGNCICVGTDDCHVLIDAGISGKKIENGLNEFDMTATDMQGILVTHEHIDHIAGLGVMDVAVADQVVQHDMNTSALGDPIGLLSGLDQIFLPSDDKM